MALDVVEVLAQLLDQEVGVVVLLALPLLLQFYLSVDVLHHVLHVEGHLYR